MNELLIKIKECGGLKKYMNKYLCEIISYALNNSNSASEAARKLGVNRTALVMMRKRFGLKMWQERKEDENFSGTMDQ